MSVKGFSVANNRADVNYSPNKNFMIYPWIARYTVCRRSQKIFRGQFGSLLTIVSFLWAAFEAATDGCLLTYQRSCGRFVAHRL
jgi:hypothetical protein